MIHRMIMSQVLQPGRFRAKTSLSLVESLAYVNKHCSTLSFGWKIKGIAHRKYHLVYILLDNLFAGLLEINLYGTSGLYGIFMGIIGLKKYISHEVD